MTTLGGQTVTRLELRYPPAGSWRAEVWLATGPVPSAGLSTLVVGDLTLERAAILPGRGGADLGTTEQPHLVVVGGAGWQREITRPASYGGPGVKVKLSTLLRDLAALAEEPYVAPPDRLVGDAYGWDASTKAAPLRLADVLDDLVTRGAIPTWRVPPDGVTRFDPWPTLGPADSFGRLVGERRMGQGVRTVGLDARVKAFLPGASFDGAPIRYLDLHEKDSELRAHVWPGVAPALASIRRVVLALFPWLVLSGVHTYQVERVNGDGTIDCVPSKRGYLAPPNLQRLPAVSQWLAGVEVAPNVGDELLVVFRDNDRARPAIVAFSPLRRATPASLKLDAGAVVAGPSASGVDLGPLAWAPTMGAVICEGDTVTVGSSTGPITIVSGTARLPPAKSKVRA